MNPFPKNIGERGEGEGRIRPPPCANRVKNGSIKKVLFWDFYDTGGQKSSDYISMQIPKFWVVTLILHLKYEIGPPGI